MAFLKTIKPEEAEGTTSEIYDMFMERVGVVPGPMEMFSASPGLMAAQLPMIGYYQQESALSPMLTTLICFLTSLVLDIPSCVEFNTQVLLKLGLTEEKIEAIAANPANAPVEEKEGWMLALVMAALRDPASVSEGHIVNLRGQGWSDADILDALYMSTRLIGLSATMKALGFTPRETDV
jgi:alkylhydroperoxidase family enzyme